MKNQLEIDDKYINSLERWFMVFEKKMINFHDKKSDTNKLNKDKISLIENQISYIQDTINHLDTYIDSLLYYIRSELIEKLKGSKRSKIYRHIYRNADEIIENELSFEDLNKENKDKLKNFNNYAEILFKLLNEIINILKRQKDYLEKEIKIENNNKNYSILKVRRNIKSKVFWDYEKLLSIEEELVSSFISVYKEKDLELLKEYNDFLKNHIKSMKYLWYWSILTSIPETPMSDISSTIPYWIASYKIWKKNRSKFNKSKYEKK